MSYDTLAKISDPNELAVRINQVLREAGVRYASSRMDKCNKTKALVHNLRFIRSHRGGFKALLTELSNLKGRFAERKRVHFLTTNFKFLKNKSARDFLMSMGMNRNTLALDIRIQNIFKHHGLELPTQAQLSKRAVYDAVESEIIEKLCTPLDVSPVVFDRILFQHYKRIIK